jgi:hypothetical protein
MTGIVESHDAAACLMGPAVQGHGLDAVHLGFKAAEPKQSRPGTGTGSHRNLPKRFAGSNLDKFQARITHFELGARYCVSTGRYRLSPRMQARRAKDSRLPGNGLGE